MLTELEARTNELTSERDALKAENQALVTLVQYKGQVQSMAEEKLSALLAETNAKLREVLTELNAQALAPTHDTAVTRSIIAKAKALLASDPFPKYGVSEAQELHESIADVFEQCYKKKRKKKRPRIISKVLEKLDRESAAALLEDLVEHGGIGQIVVKARMVPADSS